MLFLWQVIAKTVHLIQWFTTSQKTGVLFILQVRTIDGNRFTLERNVSIIVELEQTKCSLQIEIGVDWMRLS